MLAWSCSSFTRKCRFLRLRASCLFGFQSDHLRLASISSCEYRHFQCYSTVLYNCSHFGFQASLDCPRPLPRFASFCVSRPYPPITLCLNISFKPFNALISAVKPATSFLCWAMKASNSSLCTDPVPISSSFFPFTQDSVIRKFVVTKGIMRSNISGHYSRLQSCHIHITPSSTRGLNKSNFNFMPSSRLTLSQNIVRDTTFLYVSELLEHP